LLGAFTAFLRMAEGTRSAGNGPFDTEKKVPACCSNHGNRSGRLKTTQVYTSSEAGQIGRSATLLQTALQRLGAGERMLALLPGPSLLAIAPAAIALAVTCDKEDRRRRTTVRQVKQSGGVRRVTEQRRGQQGKQGRWKIDTGRRRYRGEKTEGPRSAG